MANEEAKKFLAVKLECMERYIMRYTSGCDNNCDKCELCYKQGNMREQIEALRIAIRSLEQEPVFDKIVKELEKMRPTVKYTDEYKDGVYDGICYALDKATEIIDKHKVESEDKE